VEYKRRLGDTSLAWREQRARPRSQKKLVGRLTAASGVQKEGATKKKEPSWPPPYVTSWTKAHPRGINRRPLWFLRGKKRKRKWEGGAGHMARKKRPCEARGKKRKNRPGEKRKKRRKPHSHQAREKKTFLTRKPAGGKKGQRCRGFCQEKGFNPVK